MPREKKTPEQKLAEQAERLAIAYDKMIEYANEIKELNCENKESIVRIGEHLKEAYRLFEIIKNKNLNKNIDEYIDRIIKLYNNIWELYKEADSLLIEICDNKAGKDIKYRFNTKIKLIQIHVDLSKDIFIQLWRVFNFGLISEGMTEGMNDEVKDTPGSSPKYGLEYEGFDKPIKTGEHDPYAGGKAKTKSRGKAKK